MYNPLCNTKMATLMSVLHIPSTSILSPEHEETTTQAFAVPVYLLKLLEVCLIVHFIYILYQPSLE
ncbi:hypothetical protein OG21DRAFT_370545 [Imleria badia]|nr:hypothetical protein OG21DRAFT_370545 [Imleria badia]